LPTPCAAAPQAIPTQASAIKKRVRIHSPRQ
jgi:hypothetical protein